MDIVKDKKTAGADEKTPSLAQYFSWVNNTNEGSTEEQTLANLDYFRWLKDTYGMQLDIYAWDAGNLDGSAGTYEKLDGEKLSKQYPEGYTNIAKAAKDLGVKLGVWCGPDGFGDTEEEANARHELLVSLCRDYEFGLFKMDGVCSGLRPEKRPEFCRMMEECRKYSPNLILLNHRLDLGEGLKYATTFLWQGGETYVDVHTHNPSTAPHHRAFTFTRGEVDGLQRLTEDHGVCLSSCMDRFDDDLIYQAFNRCLILAPEIYANPWLLRDDEHAKLAHIYNLHRRLRDILVDGMILPEEIYGVNAVSRGDSERRILSFGNPSWKKKTVNVTLNEEIGLEKCDKVAVIIHHPYTHLLGVYEYGQSVPVNVDPFRAVLLEICNAEKAPKLLCDKPHQVIGLDGYKLVDTEYNIKKIGVTASVPIPATNAARLAETALFTMDNDSLERRSLRRAGPTSIPEVQKTRDFFFNQRNYVLRGCDSEFAFDGKKDTFFDGVSFYRWGNMRLDGGCLRVDFGKEFNADKVEFEYFVPNTPTLECSENKAPEKIDISTDLLRWRTFADKKIDVIEEETVTVVSSHADEVYQLDGKRCVLSFDIKGSVRYLRMPEPLSRIYRISLVKDGKVLELENPRANNLMPSIEKRPVIGAQKTVVRVKHEDWKDGSYLSIAMEGIHGVDGAFVALECIDNIYAAPDRAPSFRSNVWECCVRKVDRNYTYYIPVTKDMLDRDLTVWVLLFDKEHTDFVSDIYLCDPLN
ncbi:MAG: hypothetical protein E7477_00805 [Ruminococcaceae bacterium]|nr:hypothetical protein [Oscillospiraceae bacterium]